MKFKQSLSSFYTVLWMLLFSLCLGFSGPASADALDKLILKACAEWKGAPCTAGDVTQITRCLHRHKDFRKWKNNAGRGGKKTKNGDIDPIDLDEDSLDDLIDVVSECIEKEIVRQEETNDQPNGSYCVPIPNCYPDQLQNPTIMGSALQGMKRCGQGLWRIGSATGQFVYDNRVTIVVGAVAVGGAVVCGPAIVAGAAGMGGAKLATCAAGAIGAACAANAYRGKVPGRIDNNEYQ